MVILWLQKETAKSFLLVGGTKMKVEDTIRDWAKKRGYRVASGGISVLGNIRTSFEELRDSGEINAAFYQSYLSKFSFLEGCSLKNPQAILVVAVPRPAHILPFSLDGKTIDSILPPTYVRYRRTFIEVRDDLGEYLSDYNVRLELLNAPLKALANQLGLLSYGRNNVGYIAGLGSYFQLVGLVSDTPCEEKIGPAGPVQKLLPRCEDCRNCALACPTGAIDGVRILIHGEKCYTLFSEAADPIPESLKPPSLKCLIGCMRCQQACPENKGLLRYKKTAISFTPDETRSFLGASGSSRRALDSAREKLLSLELTEDFPIFLRNIRNMFELRRIAVSDVGSTPSETK